MSRPTSENTRTVVGWKAGVAARLRAEPEVGSESGRVWMVETACRSQWMGSKDAKPDCAQRTMITICHMNRNK
jgi:hypothetical protein